MWIELSVSGPARGIVDSPLHVGDQGISRALLMGHSAAKDVAIVSGSLSIVSVSDC